MAQTYNLSMVFRAVDKATGPLRKIAGSFKGFEKPIISVDRALKSLSNNPSWENIKRQTRRMSMAFAVMGREIKKRLDNARAKVKEFGVGMERIGRKAFKRITLPLFGAGVAAFKMSMDFNKAMANVATLIPGNVDRLKDLKKGTQDVALAMGKSTGDIAGGLYQVISAFGDSSETMERLKITAMAATAGVASTEEALNLISAVTKGYGDTSAEAMMKVSDLAFMTVKLGQTTFPELAASMGRVVSIGRQLGVSQEELFSVFATLTGVTGNASEVSTQLSSALTGLMTPGDELSAVFDSLGKKWGIAHANARKLIEARGLSAVLRAVMELTKGNEELAMTYLGRKEGVIAALALTGAQADTWAKKSEAMLKVNGSMVEAFKEQTEGINKAGFMWDVLKTRIQVFSQRIGDSFSPQMEKVLGYLDRLFQTLEQAPANVKKSALMIGLAGIIGPPALLALSQVLIAMSLISAEAVIFLAAIAAAVLVWKKWDPLIVEIGESIRGLILIPLIMAGKTLTSIVNLKRKIGLHPEAKTDLEFQVEGLQDVLNETADKFSDAQKNMISEDFTELTASISELVHTIKAQPDYGKRLLELRDLAGAETGPPTVERAKAQAIFNQEREARIIIELADDLKARVPTLTGNINLLIDQMHTGPVVAQ